METRRDGSIALMLVVLCGGSDLWSEEWSEEEPAARRRTEARRLSLTNLLPLVCLFLCHFADSLLRPRYELHSNTRDARTIYSFPGDQKTTMVDRLRPLLWPNHWCASLLLLPFVVLHSAMIFRSHGHQIHALF